MALFVPHSLSAELLSYTIGVKTMPEQTSLIKGSGGGVAFLSALAVIVLLLIALFVFFGRSGAILQ